MSKYAHVEPYNPTTDERAQAVEALEIAGTKAAIEMLTHPGLALLRDRVRSTLSRRGLVRDMIVYGVEGTLERRNYAHSFTLEEVAQIRAFIESI